MTGYEMKNLKLLCVALGLMVASAVSATPTYVNFDSTETVVTTKAKINGHRVRGALGTYNLVYETNGQAETFTGFCVDPFQWAKRTPYEYQISTLDPSDFINGGADRYNNVQKLFDNAYSGLGDNNVKTAGFHLALWEIFVDDLDLSSGAVQTYRRTNNAVEAYANDLLASLSGWDVTNQFEFMFAKNDNYQDYLVAMPSAVPVPAALPLFASALAGFSVVRRRKAKAL